MYSFICRCADLLCLKADGVRFGRLAGGILASAQREPAVLDAVGSKAIANAAKALALANALPKAVPLRLAFEPQMWQATEGSEGSQGARKGCSLVVHAQSSEAQEPESFSRGGIFVADPRTLEAPALL